MMKMSNGVVWKIKYNKFSDGKSPVNQRLKRIGDNETTIRIIKDINKMKFGNFGDSQSVGGGVRELRLDYGPGYRVYYARVGKAKILILCVGDKSTQSADIEYAKRCLSQYKKDRKD